MTTVTFVSTTQDSGAKIKTHYFCLFIYFFNLVAAVDTFIASEVSSFTPAVPNEKPQGLFFYYLFIHFHT